MANLHQPNPKHPHKTEQSLPDKLDGIRAVLQPYYKERCNQIGNQDLCGDTQRYQESKLFQTKDLTIQQNKVHELQL